MARPKSTVNSIVGIVGALDESQQKTILNFLSAMTSGATVDDDVPAAKTRKEKVAPVAEKKKPGRPAKVVEEDNDDEEDNDSISHADIMSKEFETLDEIQEAMSAAFSDDESNLTEPRNEKRFLSFMKKMSRGFTEEQLIITKDLREVAEDSLFDVDALLPNVGPRAKAKVLGNNLYVCALIYTALTKHGDNIDSLLEEAGYEEDTISELSDHDKIHYVIAAANGLTFDSSEDEDEEGDEEDEDDTDEEDEKPAKKTRKAKDEDEDEDFDAPTPRRRRAKA